MNVQDEDEYREINSYEKQIYDLKQLLEISRSFSSMLDFSTLIESIIYICLCQMKTSEASIFIHKTPEDEYFRLDPNFSGFDITNIEKFVIPTNTDFIKFLEKENRTYTIEELENKQDNFEEISLFKELKPTLIIPLTAKNHLNGILVLGNRIAEENTYTIYEKEHILNIASLASIAIHNAALLEMSTTDMMTHLKLKHYFFTVLQEKMDMQISTEHPITIFMLDIDFFKRFNDTYGHACGDYVLIEVASLIQSNVEKYGIAARYGGEEFVVAIENLSESEAVNIAEKIRSSLENLNVEYEYQQLNITISIGVAIYNKELQKKKISAKELIDMADQALYESKHKGRNRVTIANNKTTFNPLA